MTLAKKDSTASFTPRDLASRLRNSSRPEPRSITESKDGAASGFPLLPDLWRKRLAELLLTVDLRPRHTPWTTLDVEHDEVRFACLLEPSPDMKEVALAWASVQRDNLSISAAEGLLLEFQASLHPRKFAESLPSNFRYLKTLHLIRGRTGIALHNYAREINWRRPILYISILKLARRFHRAVVAGEHMTQESYRKGFTGRLGVSTVLISRFESVGISDANEAVESLLVSIDQGNDLATATAYLLEAMCVHYDITGDGGSLEKAWAFIETDEQLASSHVGWHLSSVETLLRLREVCGEADRRISIREACVRILQSAHPLALEAEERIRLVVLAEIVNSLEGADSMVFRGFRIPFGFRHKGQNPMSDKVGRGLVRAVGMLARKGEPLARGIYADLLDAIEWDDGREVAKLRMTIEMLGEGRDWLALTDERSLLLCCRERLRLAELALDNNMRTDALCELLGLAEGPSCSTAALVLIARDVERNGAVEVPIGKAAIEDVVRLQGLISRGDFRALLAEAASDALASPDLAVTSLGGRSGVATVSDYFELVGGTFVFKTTTVLQWLREMERSEALEGHLQKMSLHDRYGVVDHFSPTRSDVADMDDQAEINTIRRFSSGATLGEYALARSADDRLRVVSEAAAYLGFINATEASTGNYDGMRRAVKVREVGRWLKEVEAVDPPALFDLFWSCYGNLPAFIRRDAHPLNWLVTKDEKILAVDLESIGWRPLTYELAQLTEDSCIFAPTDWSGRLAALACYLDACGIPSSPSIVEAFEASVAARSLRKLTPPIGFGSVLQDGREVLAYLAENATSASVRTISREVGLAWQGQRSLPDVGPRLNVGLSEAVRISTSRAMSYYLRHSGKMAKDGSGWVEIVDLAELFGPTIDSLDLILVATDFREPRFEIAGSRIRARYGHTADVQIELDVVSIDDSLFHATSFGVAERILLRDGLLPMKRRYVHLSTDSGVATVSGSRHGPGVVLTMEGKNLNDLCHAGESTYVVPRVASRALRVVPVWH